MTENKGDLISREALKNELTRLRWTEENGFKYRYVLDDIIDNAPTVSNEYDDGFNAGYAEAIKNIPEYRKLADKLQRPQGEWISISERLPDKNMFCLVSVGKFNFTQIAMYSDLMGTIDHKIFWQGDYDKNNFQNITEYVNAWMPLPEPYKKGGAE